MLLKKEGIMDTDYMEELFDRYIAMQDVHREAVENNISMLKKGKNFLTDVDVLTLERDMLFKEIKDYFENIFPDEKSDDNNYSSKSSEQLEDMVEKLEFILEREDDLEIVLIEYKKLLSNRLGKMRKGKNALDAYGRAWS